MGSLSLADKFAFAELSNGKFVFVLITKPFRLTII